MSIPTPRPIPLWPVQCREGPGGRGAYLAHVEVEEDTGSHLGDEDQEEEDEVLGTQGRKSAGSLPPGPTSDAPTHGARGRAGRAGGGGGPTHQPQQAADLVHGANAAQEAHEHGDGAHADEDVGPHIERVGGSLWGWKERRMFDPAWLSRSHEVQTQGQGPKVQDCFRMPS